MLTMLTRGMTGLPAIAALALLAGCSGGGAGPDSAADRSSDPSGAASSSSTQSPAPTATAEDVDAAPQVEEVERATGYVETVLRARDGSTLVLITNETNMKAFEKTFVRIYDASWQPTTPLLRADVRLEGQRGLRRGFVAWAWRSKDRDTVPFRGWVIIDEAGQVRPLPGGSRGDERVPVRPGDVALTGPRGGTLAYRPAADAVVTTRSSAWRSASTMWFAEQTGSICAVQHPSRPGDLVRSSVDEGRTWLELDTSVLPDGSGRRLQSCVTQGKRVVMTTGGEWPHSLHTFDRHTGSLLSTHPLMDKINGYAYTLLPDGALIAGTHRDGVLVATDTTNQRLRFRPAPVPWEASQIVVLDDQIILLNGLGLTVSDDRGVTWREVDLGLDG